MSERRMWPSPTKADGERGSLVYQGNHNLTLLGAARGMEIAPNASSQLTLFAEAFPASRTPSLAAVPVPTTSATSGPSSRDSFASLDHDGSWRKTCQGYSQVTLDGSLERFSETWPRAGLMSSGTAYRLPHLEHRTDETESGLWPTASATDGMGGPRNQDGRRGRQLRDIPGNKWPTPTGRDHKDGSAQACANVPVNGLLGRVIHQWPTPAASTVIGGPHGLDGGSWNRAKLRSLVGDEAGRLMASGSLNPAWVEALMGYPKGWTEL